MSYFQDLTEYTYNPRIKGIKNVGWLSKGNEYSNGEVDPNILERLKSMKPSVISRGFFDCEFCDNAKGSSELWVCSKEGQIYSTPNLISHYIEAHGYKPPQEFLDAVESGYIHGEPEFKIAMKNLTFDLK